MLKKLLVAIIIGVLLSSQFVLADQENIDVTATIQPQPSDFTISISSDKAEGSEIALSEIVTYTISYQANSYTGFPLTIVGSWEQGLIEGTSTYVDAYNYVLGSATNAHDSTPPIIDLLNNTITWTMPSVSHDATPYEVSFQLQAKDSFLTTNRIITYANADATYGAAHAPQVDDLLYINTPTPSNTVTPTPVSDTPTVGPTNTVIPSPTQLPQLSHTQNSLFEKVRIDDVGAEEVLISVITNIDSNLEVNYGLCSSDALSQQIRSLEYKRYHEVTFEQLTPDSVYCFQIFARNNELDKSIASDIFTFHTAKEDIAVRVHSTATIWQNIRLNSRSVKNLGVPRDVPIVITLDIDNAESLSLLEGEFVNRSILGLTTAHSPNFQKVDFIELAPGVFSAEIMTPHRVDQYYFTLKIKDEFGGYTKRVLPYSYQVADPIKIIDFDGNPIENAHLKIERFEESRKEFVVFNDVFPQAPFAKSFFQPYYSDQDGYVFIALPVGTYRITTTAIGYEQKMQEFYLGDDFLKFPEISLRSQFSLTTIIEYLSFAVLTAYEVFVGDIKAYFSTSVLHTVLLLYEALMLAFVLLYTIEKFGILSKLHSKVGKQFAKISNEVFHSILGTWSISNVFITLFLILFRGLQQSLLFIFITAVVALLDIYLYIIHEKSTKN